MNHFGTHLNPNKYHNTNSLTNMAYPQDNYPVCVPIAMYPLILWNGYVRFSTVTWRILQHFVRNLINYYYLIIFCFHFIHFSTYNRHNITINISYEKMTGYPQLEPVILLFIQIKILCLCFIAFHIIFPNRLCSRLIRISCCSFLLRFSITYC